MILLQLISLYVLGQSQRESNSIGDIFIMKWTLSFILVILFSTVSLAQDVLLPVKTSKGIGFVNQAGKMLIKPKYDEAYGFYDAITHTYHNISPVRVGNKWGFIDRKGKMIVEPRFEQVYSIYEGMAPVKYDGKWGAINEKGRLVVTAVYDSMSWFEDGYAAVEVGGKKDWAYISKAGQLIIPNNNVQKSKSNIRLRIKSDNKYGFMDEKGNIVIPTQFEEAYRFNGDVCGVMSNGKAGVINKSGTHIVMPNYENITFTGNGKIVIAKMNGKYALLDLSGKTMVPHIYDAMKGTNDPVNGLYAACLNEMCGYIKLSGEIHIPFQYNSAFEFDKNGLAAVKTGDKWGIIDTTGKTVIEPRYGSIPYVVSKKAVIVEPAESKDVKGVIDMKGNYIRPPVYSKIRVAYPGIIECEIGDRTAYFKATGEVIWNPNNLP